MYLIVYQKQMFFEISNENLRILIYDAIDTAETETPISNLGSPFTES